MVDILEKVGLFVSTVADSYPHEMEHMLWTAGRGLE